MRKGIIAVVVALALFAVGALAASFTLDAEDVSSGADEVAACVDGESEATVRWLVDDSDAFTPDDQATFMITEADINAPGCENNDFVLAIELDDATEVLCSGALVGGAANIDIVDDCDAGDDLNVGQVVGAALLIGDAVIDLNTTSFPAP